MSQPIPIEAARKQAELCVQILNRVSGEVALGHPADRVTSGIYREHREFGSRDRRFFSNIVFSWFRWRGWLQNPETPSGKDIISAFLLDSDDVHPAIERLAHDSGNTAELQPMGVMSIPEKSRLLARQAGLDCPPRAEQLVPAWTEDSLFYPPEVERNDHLVRCIDAFQSRPPMWLRLKKRASNATVELISKHSASIPVSLPGACALEKRADWENLPTRCKAEMEIQDLASQCVGAVCAPAPGEEWWDACAGSGGKALHLADMMERGLIFATDIRPGILREGLRRVQQGGKSLIKFREWDGRSDPAPGQSFDGVLVDAPCSGLGTWHRNPDARWRTAQETVMKRAAAQLNLLRAAASKVRPGGKLVYSICTITHAETTGVAEDFLKNHSDFRLSGGVHPLSGEPTNGLFWIWPWQAKSNAMFIAVFVRQ